MDLSTGLFAPKGLPQVELDILHEAFKKALEDPETIEQLNKMSLEPLYASPVDYQKEISETSKSLKAVLKEDN